MVAKPSPPGSAAGCSGKPLWQKLGLKPGQRIALIDPPGDYAALTGFDLSRLVQAESALDVAHLFVRDRASLARAFALLPTRMGQSGMIWVSWPKKSSSMFRDLTEDGVREIVLPAGWVDVKVCAVDADWSGLKLLRRRSA